MADFFNVLNKMAMGSEHGGVPTFLSTHPDPGDRYNSVKSQTLEWQKNLNYASWKVNGDSYLKMINGIVYGDDPRQGFVEANMFYHPGMKFKYPVPPGWQVQNSPVQVQMAPKDGKAMMIFTMASQNTLEEAAQKNLADLNLTVLDSKRTTVNGFPAVAAISQQVSQNQQTGVQQVIKVMSYLIQANNAIFVFHGVSDDANFNSYYRIFESTMTNFDRLTDPAKLNVKPKRIKVVQVQATGTLTQTFKSLKVPESQMKELALLNNLELTNQVVKGKLIKIIGE
jgi:predicted Zn-dependent protease